VYSLRRMKYDRVHIIHDVSGFFFDVLFRNVFLLGCGFLPGEAVPLNRRSNVFGRHDNPKQCIRGDGLRCKGAPAFGQPSTICSA
jgi:hypothetical protein